MKQSLSFQSHSTSFQIHDIHAVNESEVWAVGLDRVILLFSDAPCISYDFFFHFFLFSFPDRVNVLFKI